MKHELKVTIEGSLWEARCTCGKWVCMGTTAREVRKEFKKHAKAVKS